MSGARVWFVRTNLHPFVLPDRGFTATHLRGMIKIAGGNSGTTSCDKENDMGESVYKIIELVGTSTESWEKAATAAVTKASESLRELRIAEVTKMDLVIENGKPTAFRSRVTVSFKYGESG